MSNKLTIIKVLPKDGNLTPTVEDLVRWRQIFAEKRMSVEEAVATGEVTAEVLLKSEDENYLTVVKIGDEHYKPNMEDLEEWRQVFEEAVGDPDFKIFTHPAVEVQVLNIGEIVAVE